MKKQQGFTLIELMIVVAITALGLVAAMRLLMYAYLKNDLEQERARAHQVVCEEMEWLRHELYTRITGGRTVTVWDNGTPTLSAFRRVIIRAKN